MLSKRIITFDVKFHHLVRVGFVKFLHCKITLYPFLIVHILEEITMCNPCFRARELWSTFLSNGYVYRLFEIIPHARFFCPLPFINLFNCLFISNPIYIICFIIHIVQIWPPGILSIASYGFDISPLLLLLFLLGCCYLLIV